jgi:cytoskeletal protein RodZ
MPDLGGKLKQAREARSVSLGEIAAATKISVTTLEALERNDYSRLPGGIFSRSFVRAYAAAVGLDPDATVDEFVVEMTRSEREAERIAHARRPEISKDDREFLERQQRAIRILRIGLLVLAVVGVGFLAYQTWIWWQSRGEPAPAEASRTVTPQTSPSGPPPTAGSAPAAPVIERLTVALTFGEDCWIRVTADGSVVLNRVVKPGESHQFDAQREVWLEVGNAGGCSWSINGKTARPLGKRGATGRWRVTRENFNAYLQ